MRRRPAQCRTLAVTPVSLKAAAALRPSPAPTTPTAVTHPSTQAGLFSRAQAPIRTFSSTVGHLRKREPASSLAAGRGLPRPAAHRHSPAPIPSRVYHRKRRSLEPEFCGRWGSCKQHYQRRFHARARWRKSHLTGSTGVTNSQAFFATTLTAATASTIVFNQNGATSLSGSLGAITRNAGSTVDITPAYWRLSHHHLHNVYQQRHSRQRRGQRGRVCQRQRRNHLGDEHGRHNRRARLRLLRHRRGKLYRNQRTLM